MTGVLMVAADAFNGERVLENTVRLVTMLFGVPIALVCLKFGLRYRKTQPDRALFTVSYALLLLLPAVGRAMNFGQPINWVTTGFYVAGLVTAGIGLYFHAQWAGWWPFRLAKKRTAKQENTDDSDE